MRILPHQQDSGGFFIAVLEKRAPLPWMKKSAQTQAGRVTPSGTRDSPIVRSDQLRPDGADASTGAAGSEASTCAAALEASTCAAGLEASTCPVGFEASTCAAESEASIETGTWPETTVAASEVGALGVSGTSLDGSIEEPADVEQMGDMDASTSITSATPGASGAQAGGRSRYAHATRMVRSSDVASPSPIGGVLATVGLHARVRANMGLG